MPYYTGVVSLLGGTVAAAAAVMFAPAVASTVAVVVASSALGLTGAGLSAAAIISPRSLTLSSTQEGDLENLREKLCTLQSTPIEFDPPIKELLAQLRSQYQSSAKQN